MNATDQPQRFRATFRDSAPRSSTIDSIRKLHVELAETILGAQEESALTSADGALIVIAANRPDAGQILSKFAAAGCGFGRRHSGGAVVISASRERIASALCPTFAALVLDAPAIRQVSINYVPEAVVALEVENLKHAGTA